MSALRFYRVKMKINKVGVKASNSLSNENKDDLSFGGVYIGNNHSEISTRQEISTEQLSSRYDTPCML